MSYDGRNPQSEILHKLDTVTYYEIELHLYCFPDEYLMIRNIL